MFADRDELLRFVHDEGVEFVDVRFCDLPGIMQHFTVPASTFDADLYEEGLAFDGSSVRGFQSIHESDMLLLPDAATARIDPFRTQKTLNINFFVHDPFTREPYSRDPRNVARKAEEYLASTGVADTAYFGAEAEFYIFDSIRFETTANSAFHEIDSISGWWNTGTDEEGGNKGYKVKYKGGYFPVPPTDHYADLRNTVVTNLIGSGFTIERAHHEVGTAGQAGINYKFNTLLHAADDLQLFKYIVKNTAHAGAGEPGVLAAQPLRLHPDPDHGQQPEGQATRVPLPRLLGQPVPGLRGDDDGRSGRHQELLRAGGTDRQGPLRAAARRDCRATVSYLAVTRPVT